MITIILLIWSIFVVWGNLKAYKTIYCTTREQRLADALESMDKGESILGEKGFKTFMIIAIILAASINSWFWMIVATTLTIKFFVFYAAFLIALNIAALFGAIGFIQTKEYKKSSLDWLGYVTAPLNTVTLGLFIMMLLSKI